MWDAFLFSKIAGKGNIFEIPLFFYCQSFNMLLFMGLGTNEIILIAIVVLLLFGGRKIPELMRGLGRGVREFNDAKSNVRKEIEEGVNEKEQRPSASSQS